MKKIFVLFLLVIIYVFPFNINASENNKFGMSVLQPSYNDLKKIAELVNSNGGDWGYVTLVIQENDRNSKKWQETFDWMRELHLIPIVRLATTPEGENWRRPNKEDAERWVEFLDKLHWVVKERYIVLFNEPNHGREWGGEVDPENYGEIALHYAQKLKEKNKDYFVMLAGFDASAPSAEPEYADEEMFLRRMLPSFAKATAGEASNIQDFIDGWSSHSYPNPGFSGNPYQGGRGTVRTYDWELQLLRELGMTKELPVFITETGWSDQNLSRDTIASYFETTFNDVWKQDNRVKAVTPFVFSYQSEPFSNFSWKKQGEDSYYSQFSKIQTLDKQKGTPDQLELGKFEFEYPKELVSNSTYRFILKIKNMGQAIWDKDYGYRLVLDGFSAGSYFFSDFQDLKPFQTADIDLYIKTNFVSNNSENFSGIISLFKEKNKILSVGEWSGKISPLPKLQFNVSLFPKRRTNGDDFEIQIFDGQDNLIYKKKNIRVTNNIGYSKEVPNVILGKKYRVVILKPYYLPKQVILTLKKGTNQILFEKMLPFDFSKDGKLDAGDIGGFFNNLNRVDLFFP